MSPNSPRYSFEADGPSRGEWLEHYVSNNGLGNMGSKSERQPGVNVSEGYITVFIE